MKEIVAALRRVALQDLPSEQRAELRALADRVEAGPDWRAVCVALLVKYGGREGSALVGSSSLAWARERVEVQTDRDGDALRFAWTSPPLNALPAPTARRDGDRR